MPEEMVEGRTGHVEVGESDVGWDDGVGCECGVQHAVPVARGVPQNNKSAFGSE